MVVSKALGGMAFLGQILTSASNRVRKESVGVPAFLLLDMGVPCGLGGCTPEPEHKGTAHLA